VGPLVLLLLLGLACYRLTRLVTADTFPPIAGPRERIDRATMGGRWGWVGKLLTCHWCASGWVSLAIVAGVDLFSGQRVPLPPVMWLAVWAVGAMIAQLEPEK
jgi:hypothetical protein